jgi:hypothetical protein
MKIILFCLLAATLNLNLMQAHAQSAKPLDSSIETGRKAQLPSDLNAEADGTIDAEAEVTAKVATAEDQEPSAEDQELSAENKDLSKEKVNSKPKPVEKPKTIKKVFIPTEEISEDKPVPFPVDI